MYDYKDKTYRLLNDTPIELTVKTTSANLEIEEAEFLTNPWFVGQEGVMRVAIKNTGEADFDGSLLFDFLEQTTFDQVEYELDFSLKAGKRQEGKIMFAIPEDLTEGIYGVDIYERSQSDDRQLTSEPLVLQIKQYVAPTGVEIDCEQLTLKEGETYTLTAKALPYDTDSPQLAWSSSDESVATVGQEGVVTAVAEGEAEISATTVNGLAAACKITVIRDTGVEEIMANEDEQIKVYNMMGVKVYEGRAGDFQMKAGLYIVSSPTESAKLLVK